MDLPADAQRGIELEGVFVPLVTPFRRSGRLDLGVVPDLVEFVLAGGVSGLVVAAGTGEGYTMDNLDRRLLLEEILSTVDGRVPVLLGVGGMSTREALIQARTAADAGSDGIFLSAPSFARPTAAELGAYVSAVMKAAGLPTLLCDDPVRTGVAFTERALDQVATAERVIGITEASGDITRLMRLRRRYGDELPVVCGADTLALPYFQQGVKCWLTGSSNALPAEHVAMLKAARSGDLIEAKQIQRRIMPFLRSCEREHYTPKVRLAITMRGVPVGPPRPPLLPPGDAEAFDVASRLNIALGYPEQPLTATTKPLTADVTGLPLQTMCFIDGRFRESDSGEFMEIVDPATGDQIGHVASCATRDVRIAVEAARHTFDAGVWSRARPGERRRVLVRLAELMAANSEELARLDSLETGRPITECREADLPEAVDSAQWFGRAADSLRHGSAATSDKLIARQIRSPMGVVGVLTAWNFPALSFAWRVMPALAIGNCVVLKPDEQAPSSALLIAELSREAELPPGVLNVVTGAAKVAGRALALNGDVDVLSFSGPQSDTTLYQRLAARSNGKAVTGQRGGAAPHIVAGATQDLDRVAMAVTRAAFWGAGQHYLAAPVLVERTISADLAERIAWCAADLRVGSPSDPLTQMGPMISRMAFQRARTALDSALQAGGRIVVGGEQVLEETGGNYLSPTVLDSVKPEAPWLGQPLGAPILPVIAFDAELEVVAMINAGLPCTSVNIWTDDADAAHRIGQLLSADTVQVNMAIQPDRPYDGYRQLGFGPRSRGWDQFPPVSRSQITWQAH